MTPSMSERCRPFGRPGTILAAIVALTLIAPTIARAQAPAGAPLAGNRFEKNVQEYEAADKVSFPAPGQILLAGDSQFFRWKTLHEDVPDFNIINRGIDSFQTSDLIYFVDRIVIPYKPRMIVLHVGGNDLTTGKSAEQLLADFKTFVAKVRVALPTVPIAFSSTTPGPARFSQAAERVRANRLLKDYIATQKNLMFIDLWDAMLTPDGKPREELWVEDRIHPNHEGYLIRVRIMRPMLGPPDRQAK